MKKLKIKRIFNFKNRKSTKHTLSSLVLALFLFAYSLVMLGWWFSFHWPTFLILSLGSLILSMIIFADFFKHLFIKPKPSKDELPKS